MANALSNLVKSISPKKMEFGLGISKPISTRAEDFAGANAQEKYKNMQDSWRKYNIERANALINELDKRGIKTSGTGMLGVDEPYTTWENSGGLQSLYMKVPGYGEVRFSDHVGPSELSQGKTFNTPDEALDAIKNAYNKKYARDLEIDSLRKQIGIVEGSDKENMKIIQDWLKNNPQQGQMKDPGWWKQKLDLGLGWSPSKLSTSNPFDKTNILAGGALGAIGLGAMMPDGEAQASEMPAQGNALSAAANRPVSHPVVRAPLTREERLNAEYGHTPMQPAYKPRNIFEKVMMDAERKRQLQEDWKVAQGELPADIAYGEEGLQAPSVAGGIVSLDPTDYIGPGALKAAGVGLKSLPWLVGGASLHGMPKGRSMERLIREAQAQIDAENAAKNALRYTTQDNRVRNALVGIGAGGAGVAGGYYGADYLAR